jgi:uncharacterized protein (TIGR02284 family)
MQKDDAISTLNNLISIAKDGVKGMSSAAENAKSPALKSTLSRLSGEREQVATQLQGLVRSLGGEPDDSGTTLGTAHRTFMNMKDAVTGYDDAKLLEECERGEDYAVQQFRAAVREELPSGVGPRVESCLHQVKKSHDEIKALRNSQR